MSELPSDFSAAAPGTYMVSQILTTFVLLASTMFLRASWAQTAADNLQLRYVANAGMLLSLEGRKFLIDAPIREGITPYATSPENERRLLEEASPPYDNVDAIRITHWHEDHFSAEAVAAHMSRNARAVFISSGEVVARVRAVAPNLDATRCARLFQNPVSHSRSMLEAWLSGFCVFAITRRAPPRAACRVPDWHGPSGAARRGRRSDGGELRCHAPIARRRPRVASVLVRGR